MVQTGKQEQIVGYFIEEAKEHLDTLERGLVHLQGTVDDPESINELFRAAHSVKGGAAMLGFEGIHKTAHHLEDCLKLLKENPVRVDQKVESLFLKGFDALRDITHCIQGPYGYREDDAKRLMQEAEPTFVQLQSHIRHLIAGEGTEAPAESGFTLPADFAIQVTDVLRQMLSLFRQPVTADSRDQLVACCDRLSQLCPTVEVWRSLMQMAKQSIGNPRNSYQALAPVVIKELKQAGEYMQAKRPDAFSPSANLQQLAGMAQQPTTLPTDPKAVAQLLIQSFSKQQLREIAQILVTALKA